MARCAHLGKEAAFPRLGGLPFLLAQTQIRY